MVPDKIRKQMQSELWSRADHLGWESLSQSEKAKWYRAWTEHSSVGGVLAGFMDPRKVRVYIKDTLMKPYRRARSSDQVRIMKLAGISLTHGVEQHFVKPHGRLIEGKVVCWGYPDNWKAVLLSTFERAFRAKSEPFAAVLVGSADQHRDRDLIEAIAERLAIRKLIWTN